MKTGGADDFGAGDEAPVATAVLAVVAVVAEDEVVAGGDDEFAVIDEGVHADPPGGVDVGVGGLEAGEVVAEDVGAAGSVHRVGFGERLAVDVDVVVVDAEVVAGQADDALDEMHGGIDGKVEDDDLAAVDGGGGQDAGGFIEADAVFGDQQEVADEEGWLHRSRRDAEGLNDEGDDEDGDDDDVEEGLDGGEQAVLVMVMVVVRDVGRLWGG